MRATLDALSFQGVMDSLDKLYLQVDAFGTRVDDHHRELLTHTNAYHHEVDA